MRNMSDDHTHVQEFFGARAADWDTRFPDDGPRLRGRRRRTRAARGRPRARRGLRHRARPAAAAGRRGALRSGPRRRSDPGHAGGRRTGRTGPRRAVAARRRGRGCRCAPSRSTPCSAAGLIAHLPEPRGESAGVGAGGAARRHAGALPPDRPGGARGPPGPADHPGRPARRAQPPPAAGRFRLAT